MSISGFDLPEMSTGVFLQPTYPIRHKCYFLKAPKEVGNDNNPIDVRWFIGYSTQENKNWSSTTYQYLDGTPVTEQILMSLPVKS